MAVLLAGALLGGLFGSAHLYFVAYAVPVGYVACIVMMAVGLMRYSNLPEESGVRGLAKAAFGLFALNVLLSIMEVVGAFTGGGGSTGGIFTTPKGWAGTVSIISTWVGAVGLVLLLLSFRKLGRFIGDFRTAGNATTALVLFGIFYGFQLLALFAPSILLSLGAGMLQVLALLLPILSFVGLIMFLVAVNSMKTSLLAGAIEEGDVF